jgi:hypothetical protein
MGGCRSSPSGWCLSGQVGQVEGNSVGTPRHGGEAPKGSDLQAPGADLGLPDSCGPDVAQDGAVPHRASNDD